MAPEQPEALASAVLAVLADPVAASRRAATAHARALERFTVDRVAAQMLAFYERAKGADTSRMMISDAHDVEHR